MKNDNLGDTCQVMPVRVIFLSWRHWGTFFRWSQHSLHICTWMWQTQQASAKTQYFIKHKCPTPIFDWANHVLKLIGIHIVLQVCTFYMLFRISQSIVELVEQYTVSLLGPFSVKTYLLRICIYFSRTVL